MKRMEGPTGLTIDEPTREELEDVVVRFAGDSGDGIQITGGQFTLTTALAGNDLTTFPDFPAEIRAPAGTTFGVSAFQIHFGSSLTRPIGNTHGSSATRLTTTSFTRTSTAWPRIPPLGGAPSRPT